LYISQTQCYTLHDMLSPLPKQTNRLADSQRIQPTAPSSDPNLSDKPTPFSHTFDLTKRLIHPASAQISFLPLSTHPSQSPFTNSLDKLRSAIHNSPPASIHRLVIPSLLSPALYPPHASLPQHILPLLHTLRSLLSTSRLTIIASLPLSLHPRSTGLTRFIELLHDGVMELSPFPHSAIPITQPSTGAVDEPPQGLLRVHKLPILHERGSGTTSYDDDWTFTLSRRKLTIKPFNLPPVDGDGEAQQAGTSGEADAKKGNGKRDMEF
jgi:elongator complex protein 4